MTMTTANNHECIHEELIQDHSLQLAELNTKSKYKEQSIMEIKDELKEMNAKIDAINNNVNELILWSKTGDTDLELRLKTTETELKNLKQELHDKDKQNNNKQNRQLTIIGLLFAAITIALNILFKFI